MAVRATSGNFFTALPSNLVIQARKNIRKIVAPIAALIVVLILWQLGSSVFKDTLPGPIQVVHDTWDLIINPFWSDGNDKGLGWQTLASLQRVAIGYSLAAIVGILAGVLIGAVPVLYDAFDPMFQILRTVPPLAWLPIALAIFKNSGPAGLFIIFVTAIWPILYNTAVGVQQMPQDYKNVRQSFTAVQARVFLQNSAALDRPLHVHGTEARDRSGMAGDRGG